MTPVLHTTALTKLYGRRPGLLDADLDIPPGRVVGLVGPNGAGKSTLLGMTCGLLEPTTGTIEVLGARPATDAAQLARISFVAQDTPVYPSLTVAEHLHMGAQLNRSWDDGLARRRLRQVGLDPAQPAGRLSGGQRAQLALTIAAAKRPELLILDEPVAALDPLARRQFLQHVMEFASEMPTTVLMSSHLIGDLERLCDYLVLLASSRVQLAGRVDDLVGDHFRLVGGRGTLDHVPPGFDVVHADHQGRQSTLIVRRTGPMADPSLLRRAERLDLEDLVLAYLTRAAGVPAPTTTPYSLEAQR